MKAYTLTIEGMSCGHCLKAVKAALQSVEDITVKEVTLGRAQIDSPSARVAEATNAVHAQGYVVTATEES